MDSYKIMLPFHYRTFHCQAGQWVCFRAVNVYTLNGKSVDVDDFERHFGLSLGQIKIELFRLNGGRDGFYLANLHNRVYYYCGLEAKDVPVKLKQLGVMASE